MEDFKRLCVECGQAFYTSVTTRNFCSDDCQRLNIQKDVAFRRDTERIKFNKEHGTKYSYGQYCALMRIGKLDPSIKEEPKNLNTCYWIRVPKKVVIQSCF